MNDKKQTAVEWLTKILENQKNEPFNFEEWKIAFEYAKEMEKEQNHSEYMRGWKNGYSKNEPI
jgi:hypothetical protein